MKAAALVCDAIVCSLALFAASATIESDGFDCYQAKDNGYTYRGLVDFSNSGRPCQNWLDVGDISPVGDNGVGNHNYCRNPDQSFDSPWCFTNDGSGLSKEECSVDKCKDEKRDFEAEAEALKRYMEVRDCDCPDLFLHGVVSVNTLPLFFAKRSCSNETSHCSLTTSVETQCHCGVRALHGIVRLTVMNSSKSEVPVWTTHIQSAYMSNVSTKSRVPGRTTHIQSANASVKKHAPSFLASYSVDARSQGPDVSAAKFADNCNTACYSAACSKCGKCIAKCQQGPHAYCKTDSKTELWFAMCGQATEEQLLGGIKQCGDPPPTGCAAQ